MHGSTLVYIYIYIYIYGEDLCEHPLRNPKTKIPSVNTPYGSLCLVVLCEDLSEHNLETPGGKYHRSGLPGRLQSPAKTGLRRPTFS